MNELEKSIQLAEFYFKNKNYYYAEAILKKIVQEEPSNPNANELLAYIRGNEGKLDEAYQYLCITCLDENCSPQAHYYLGCIQLNKNLYREGINSVQQAIKKRGEFYEAIFVLGVLNTKIGDVEKALNLYQKALQINKNSHELFFNIGIVYQDLENFEEAIKNYDKAINLKNDYVEACLNKAIIFKKLKRFEEAEALTRKVIDLNPRMPEAQSSMGHTLSELRRHEEALLYFDKAITLQPNYAEAWSNKGHALSELKRHEEALLYFDKAITLQPNYAEAWSNKGHALSELKRHEEALLYFDKAITLQPNYAEAWSNKGFVLCELRRYEEALLNFDNANDLNQDADWIKGHIIHTKMKICKWDNLQEELRDISNLIKAGKKVITPFAYIALTDNIIELKLTSEIFSNKKSEKKIPIGQMRKKSKGEKIKIAYFSADFRDHPVSILTAELFELHNKKLFETYAFSFGNNDNGPMRKRLMKSFDQFMDVRSISDKEIAEIARNLEIDIAIDLGGYTAENRIGIFSYRPAPIQISYIGFLGTMCNSDIDYILADEITIPNEAKKSYTEKIIYLPSYQVNDRKRLIPQKKFTREELGLPEKGFVFACFNNNYKFMPNIFDAWMEILIKVENSVLFLYAENKSTEINLIKEAAKKNISKHRIIFGNKISAEKYLARYRLCDLFLDTFPYNGGTTCSDALWMGLPVITMMGQSFASRYASSILHSIDLSELVAHNIDEYKNLAIQLAENSVILDEVKKKIQRNRENSLLFDTPKFTENLEKAYTQIYKRWCSNLLADNIYVGLN